MARFLNRVRLENYKSIAHCDVELKDLTFLVGPNGAGKSNFLSSLTMILVFQIRAENTYDYNLTDVIRRGTDFVESEFFGIFGQLDIYIDAQGRPIFSHLLNDNFPETQITTTKISIIPLHYKKPIESKNTKNLFPSGDNMPNILLSLQNNDKISYQKINHYLSRIIPEISKVWVLQAGGYDILQFDCVGNDNPFNASQMSDGTLHALGVLTAIFHAKSAGIPLIGIEEPEAGLHPAAARVLRDALIEASKDVQIIVTSHSPDLLDSPDIDPDSILAVVRENGETKIGPIDAASRQALKEHLFTAGELLRMNQLEPAA